MPYFVLNGYPNCPNYMHAVFVAQYLSEHLPNFQYKRIEKTHEEWVAYLLHLNKENQWYATKSPLIWKEISMWGGKKYLIGGLSEFWEYCYSYYGFESLIPKSELQKLAESNMKFFEESRAAESLRAKNNRIISILGATSEITLFVIYELLNVPQLRKREGIIFKLYDDLIPSGKKNKVLEETANYYNDLKVFGSRDIVEIVTFEKETLQDCDLLIHVEDFRQRRREKQDTWLERCYARMNYLSDIINASGNRNLRVVLSNPGPVCFLANCLVEFCTGIRPSNIVAVTADEGLPVIAAVSKKTGVPVHEFSAPPVWGFIGINSFVDIRHIVFKGDVYRPNQRSLTAPRGSTLPLGTIKSELRLMPFLVEDYDEIMKSVQENRKFYLIDFGKNHKEMAEGYTKHCGTNVYSSSDILLRISFHVAEKYEEKLDVKLQRPVIFAKVRALTSLLKLWYAEDRPDDIISLGVCSNGSFGIPPGVVFSQPVILNEKYKWTPLTRFPLMNHLSKEKISACVSSTKGILKACGLLRCCCRDDDDICSNPDCPAAASLRLKVF